MSDPRPIVIVGGGPAGLSCAAALAQSGENVVLFEKKTTIGIKVCAGGVTWNGQLQHLPEKLIQRKFYTQRLVTPYQNLELVSSTPMVATINRIEVGSHMVKHAVACGADVQNQRQVVKINKRNIVVQDTVTKETEAVPFKYLIGADGANSIVRSHLGFPVTEYGVGIHFQIPKEVEEMEWHFAPRYFENGYGWIFPHKTTVSIGAYCDRRALPAADLKHNLIAWAKTVGYDLTNYNPKAEKISYDYRGWNFGNIFLIGEAAGICSALTGEGINGAVLSGEFLANHIKEPEKHANLPKTLLKRRQEHQDLIIKTNRSKFLKNLLPELFIAALRLNLISFDKLELTT